MKRYISILFSIAISLLFSLNLSAANSKRMSEANKLYSAEKYAEADSLYTSILQEEGFSAALYYNLGNAKYKQGEIASAILNYERALKLDPNNEDVRFNLEMAKMQTTDKIEELDKFFLSEWNRSLQGIFSSNGWSRLAIICFLMTLAGIALYFFGKIISLRKTAFFASIFTAVICIVSIVYAKRQKDEQLSHDTAIIFAPSTTGKGSPDESGTDLFVLHEGTKVKVKSSLNGWVEIQMADGNVGWIPEKDLEII